MRERGGGELAGDGEIARKRKTVERALEAQEHERCVQGRGTGRKKEETTAEDDDAMRQRRWSRWHCHLTKECRDLTRISLTAAWPEGDGKYEEKKSEGAATAFIGAKELVKQTVCPFRRFRLPLKRSLDEDYPEGWLLGVANVSLVAHEKLVLQPAKCEKRSSRSSDISLFRCPGSYVEGTAEKKRLAVSLFRFIKSQTVWTISRDCGGDGMGE